MSNTKRSANPKNSLTGISRNQEATLILNDLMTNFRIGSSPAQYYGALERFLICYVTSDDIDVHDKHQRDEMMCVYVELKDLITKLDDYNRLISEGYLM